MIYFFCLDNGMALASEVVAVETCMPGAGNMKVGVGATPQEAKDSLERTPLEGHHGCTVALEWAVEEGWAAGPVDPYTTWTLLHCDYSSLEESAAGESEEEHGYT